MSKIPITSGCFLDWRTIVSDPQASLCVVYGRSLAVASEVRRTMNLNFDHNQCGPRDLSRSLSVSSSVQIQLSHLYAIWSLRSCHFLIRLSWPLLHTLQPVRRSSVVNMLIFCDSFPTVVPDGFSSINRIYGPCSAQYVVGIDSARGNNLLLNGYLHWPFCSSDAFGTVWNGFQCSCH